MKALCILHILCLLTYCTVVLLNLVMSVFKHVRNWELTMKVAKLLMKQMVQLLTRMKCCWK